MAFITTDEADPLGLRRRGVVQRAAAPELIPAQRTASAVNERERERRANQRTRTSELRPLV
jgi:hypothetical protein